MRLRRLKRAHGEVAASASRAARSRATRSRGTNGPSPVTLTTQPHRPMYRRTVERGEDAGERAGMVARHCSAPPAARRRRSARDRHSRSAPHRTAVRNASITWASIGRPAIIRIGLSPPPMRRARPPARMTATGVAWLTRVIAASVAALASARASGFLVHLARSGSKTIRSAPGSATKRLPLAAADQRQPDLPRQDERERGREGRERGGGGGGERERREREREREREEGEGEERRKGGEEGGREEEREEKRGREGKERRKKEREKERERGRKERKKEREGEKGERKEGKREKGEREGGKEGRKKEKERKERGREGRKRRKKGERREERKEGREGRREGGSRRRDGRAASDRARDVTARQRASGER